MKRPAVADLVEHHLRTEEALSALGRDAAVVRYPDSRFFGMSLIEFREALAGMANEEVARTVLAIVAATEAELRLDFAWRIGRRSKVAPPQLRVDLRDLRERYGDRIRLGDLLGVWRSHTRGIVSPSVFDRFQAQVELRHWLAHGRYWTPKVGVPADVATAADVALTLGRGLHAIARDYPGGRGTR